MCVLITIMNTKIHLFYLIGVMFGASCLLLVEILDVVGAWLQLTLLDFMDDFHYFVVHRRRASDLSAVVGNGSVDGVHLGQFTFFEVLEHAGLQLGVFADGDRDYEE